MTRKHAEKIAAAIVATARASGASWNATSVELGDVAAALKKPVEVLAAEVRENLPLIWGCLPMGWNLALGASRTTVAVARRDPELVL